METKTRIQKSRFVFVNELKCFTLTQLKIKTIFLILWVITFFCSQKPSCFPPRSFPFFNTFQPLCPTHKSCLHQHAFVHSTCPHNSLSFSLLLSHGGLTYMYLTQLKPGPACSQHHWQQGSLWTLIARVIQLALFSHWEHGEHRYDPSTL